MKAAEGAGIKATVDMLFQIGLKYNKRTCTILISHYLTDEISLNTKTKINRAAISKMAFLIKKTAKKLAGLTITFE